jgi:protein tyrosine phosphatase
MSSSLASENAAVIEFLDSAVKPKFSVKQFKRLEKLQNEREYGTGANNQWTRDTGQYFPELNRYSDVSPYDATRVVLSSKNGKSGGNKGHDYINASYIYTPKRGKRYIATQAPRWNTIEDFWRMVWDNVSKTQSNTVSTIIMLTELAERGIEKCIPYWPRKLPDKFEFQHGDESGESLVVTLTGVEKVEAADCTVSTIELCIQNPIKQDVSPRYRVKHMLYHGWLDMAVPSSTETFLNYYQLYRQYHTSEASPIIHCSAGIGRTGVFIAVDYLMSTVPRMSVDEILEDPVFESVNEMRKWRMSMVYRPAQLEYIYTLFKDIVLGDAAKQE